MEYKLCKDYDNMLRCNFDCRKCANLVYEAMTDANKNLRTEKDRLESLFQIKSKENTELIDKCQELEKKNAWFEKECEKLRDDRRRFANECRYYIDRESSLVTENDKLRTMNSDLIYRNGQLLRGLGPTNFLNSYGELSDKIEGLKEDIIRLDKCLSKRQCVQLERIKEERDGE